ncbi:MAG: ABC transporter ATP-binding protein [Spirochaetia bacterium]|jgi:oligopeptide transport system ATP-binding protein|nr:ABC transporter ATP-binding protein [Spirochaetia bacterium]
MSKALLTVDNLHTSFFTQFGEVKAIRGVSFHVDEREIIGIVGESGSGKSVTSLSIMKLLTYPGKIVGGSIAFQGEELTTKSQHQMRKIRGNRISMIFQDPMTSLNPLYTVGNQIVEAINEHQHLSPQKSKEKAIEMLSLVRIPSPEERFNCYPHEFSGGMRQRVMIAMALCCQPQLLIADEPTTALDVTIQAQVLELLKNLNQELHTSVILITHNLGCVATTCSRVLVMYGGKIMEEGTTEEIFYALRHPYTMGLLRSVPTVSDTQTKKRLVPILGTPPDLLRPPKGCPFYPRCDFAMEICRSEEVPAFEFSPTHKACCWLCHAQAPKVEAYEQQQKGVFHG